MYVANATLYKASRKAKSEKKEKRYNKSDIYICEFYIVRSTQRSLTSILFRALLISCLIIVGFVILRVIFVIQLESRLI